MYRATFFLALLPLLPSTVQAANIGFYPLPQPHPTHIYSFGGAVSGNGLVAGGESGVSSFSPRNTTGAIWSSANFAQASVISPPTSAEPWTYLTGLNWDGTMGTGIANIAVGNQGTEVEAVPIRWTSAGGVQTLTPNSGSGHDISTDGKVIVGQWSDPANPTSFLDGFRWSDASGLVSIPRLPGAAAAENLQTAYAVSDDGTVVVGRARNGDSQPISVGYAWTEALGSRQLALLPGSTGTSIFQARSIAWGINGAGTIIVGEARDSSTGRNAALWRFDQQTGNSTIVSLGDLPGAPLSNPTGLPSAAAKAVSADGKVIVGDGQSSTGTEAFIWREEHGMVSLRSYLIDTLGVSNLDGWHLSSAADISDDGLTIVGYGTWQGETLGYVAIVPEPATGLLPLWAAFLASATWRKRRSTGQSAD